jgi:hypothetical protein
MSKEPMTVNDLAFAVMYYGSVAFVVFTVYLMVSGK